MSILIGNVESEYDVLSLKNKGTGAMDHYKGICNFCGRWNLQNMNDLGWVLLEHIGNDQREYNHCYSCDSCILDLKQSGKVGIDDKWIFDQSYEGSLYIVTDWYKIKGGERTFRKN